MSPIDSRYARGGDEFTQGGENVAAIGVKSRGGRAIAVERRANRPPGIDRYRFFRRKVCYPPGARDWDGRCLDRRRFSWLR